MLRAVHFALVTMPRRHCPGKNVHPKAWRERAIEGRITAHYSSGDYTAS
jgi:hypothetical protein